MSPSELARFAERTGLQEMLRQFPEVLRESAAKAAESRMTMPARCKGTSEPAHQFVVLGAPVD